jgi:hypothetical protein
VAHISNATQVLANPSVYDWQREWIDQITISDKWHLRNHIR